MREEHPYEKAPPTETILMRAPDLQSTRMRDHPSFVWIFIQNVFLLVAVWPRSLTEDLPSFKTTSQYVGVVGHGRGLLGWSLVRGSTVWPCAQLFQCIPGYYNVCERAACPIPPVS